jgi:hypothetical protein
MTQQILRFVIKRFLRTLSLRSRVNTEVSVIIEEILQVFEAGFCTSLSSTPETAREAASQIVWNRRGFFWEGAAAGLASRHSLRFSRGNPDGRKLTEGYRQMHYTGYGLWNGLASAFWLPVCSLNKERWRGVADFDMYKPLIAGGISFASAIMAGGLDDRVLRKLPIASVWDQQTAIMHGLGRALWFHHMHDIPRLISEVNAHPEHAEALMEGVGLGMAYTQVATPKRIIVDCERFSPSDCEHLLRGIGAGLAQMIEETPEVRANVEEAAQGILLRPFQLCRMASEGAQPGTAWYQSYVDLMRSHSMRVSP